MKAEITVLFDSGIEKVFTHYKPDGIAEYDFKKSISEMKDLVYTYYKGKTEYKGGAYEFEDGLVLDLSKISAIKFVIIEEE